MWRILATIGLLLWSAAALCAPHDQTRAEVEAALQPLRGGDLAGSWRLVDVRSVPHVVRIRLKGPGGKPATIMLRHPDRTGHAVASFAVRLQTSFSQIRNEQDRAGKIAIQQVLDHLDASGLEGAGQRLQRAQPSPWLRDGARTYRWLPAAVLALMALVWTRNRAVNWDIRPNHAVPAVIQLTLYSYWCLYVFDVRVRLVDIAAQVAFAYAFEAFLRWFRGQTWHITLAPLPVVFSTNLFVWFIDPWLQCSVIALALASKEAFRRDGRHIFNPSALAVSTAALATLVLPSTFGWGTPTPDVEMNLPPNMAELMLILTVIAQLRFPIVLVPMAAALGIEFAGALWLRPPNPYWPATFLILLLFSTDPKTLPKATSGRVLFGLLLGLLLSVISAVLSSKGLPDTYAKVIPIPFLNYLAPQLDRIGEAIYASWKRRVRGLGERIPEGFVTILEPRLNRWHVAVWLVLAIAGISEQKANSFQVLAHWEQQTPKVVSGSHNGFPTCAENPVWCTPFSFAGEARLWLGPQAQRVDPPLKQTVGARDREDDHARLVQQDVR